MISRIVDWIGVKQNLNEDEKRIFQYGFELLLNSAANFCIVLLIGFLYGYFLHSLIFLVSYIFVKKDSGGYHAKSHVSCVFQFNMAYLLLVKGYSFWKLNTPMIYVICIVAVTFIFLYAPIISKNKSISKEEASYHKKRARIKILILCVAGLTGEFLFHNTYSDFIFLAICMIAITMMLGRILEFIETGRI